MKRMTKNRLEKQASISFNKKCTVSKIQIVAAVGIGSFLFAASGLGFAWADSGQNTTGDIQIKATDAIKNNPTAMSILYNIELFKQRYAALQQRQQLQDQQQQFIDQQRKIANEYLQSDLAGLNVDNQNNARNAYASFVSNVDSSAQSVFWDQFAYMQDKVAKAKIAMNEILQNGGSMQDALQAYNNAASMQKTELVSVNKDLNVKYHLADPATQDLFNKYGSFRKYTAS